jgi:hypothetical protein
VPQYFLDGRSIFWTAAVFFGRPQYFLDGRSIFWTAAVFLGARRCSACMLPSPSCGASTRFTKRSRYRGPETRIHFLKLLARPAADLSVARLRRRARHAGPAHAFSVPEAESRRA